LVTLLRFLTIDDNFLYIPMTLSLKVLGLFVCISAGCALAQDTAPRDPDVAQLGRELQQTRSELAESRREIQELRQSLEELRRQVQGQPSNPSASPNSNEPTTAAADQDVGFLAAKVSELHQDKVESASKYPVKLSGLILFNSYWNKGILDTQDLPNMACQSFPAHQTRESALLCDKPCWGSTPKARKSSELKHQRAWKSISVVAVPPLPME
jgi:hypothetical protein